MESHIEQEESDSSRQSADLRIRKTQVLTHKCCIHMCLNVKCLKKSFKFKKIRKSTVV
jgi:hypothetical protein